MSRPIITDLVQIRRLGEQKLDENKKLRQHMSRHNYVERKLKVIAQNSFINLIRTQIFHVQLDVRANSRELFTQTWHFRKSNGINGRYPESPFDGALKIVHRR